MNNWLNVHAKRNFFDVPGQTFTTDFFFWGGGDMFDIINSIGELYVKAKLSMLGGLSQNHQRFFFLFCFLFFLFLFEKINNLNILKQIVWETQKREWKG